MKKHLILTVSTIILLACSVMTTQRPADVSAEEYAVYSALIPDMLAETKAKLFVIEEKTTNYYISDGLNKNEQYFKQMFPTLTDEVVKDYRAKNRTRSLLKDSFYFKEKHVPVRNQELQRIFKGAGRGQSSTRDIRIPKALFLFLGSDLTPQSTRRWYISITPVVVYAALVTTCCWKRLLMGGG